ncbi:hypothetical protein A6R68_07735, partial [Neotoma lepida]
MVIISSSTINYEEFILLSEINDNPNLKHFPQFLKAQRHTTLVELNRIH